MNDGTTARKLLTRKEAADYLTQHHFRTSLNLLNRYAIEQVGPKYVCRQGRGQSFYRPDDLDEWARGFLRPPSPPAGKAGKPENQRR